MGLIQNLIKGMGEDKKELKAKFKEAQQNRKIENMLEEREKSANQRELERHFKEQREKNIKDQLEVVRMKRKKDTWKGNSILKGHKNILHEDKKALASGKSILKQKNIFLDHRSDIPLTKKELFKGW